MTKRTIQKILPLLFTILGAALLIKLIHGFGINNLLKLYEQLGWELIPIITIPLSWFSFQAYGWHEVLAGFKHQIKFIALLRIKLAGEALNTVTPVSFMGGDPLRIYLLNKDIPGTAATASVVLDRTIQTVAVVIFILLGLISSFLFLDLPPQWKIVFPLVAFAITSLLWFFLHRQQQGVFAFLSRALHKLGFKKHMADHIQEKITELDQRITQFYRNDRKHFYTSTLHHVLARLCGVVEIYVIAQMLHITLSFNEAFILATANVLVNFVFVFIPGSLGVMEGAFGALFLLMGHAPVQGLAIQLVRRFRTLVWIGIGLIVWKVQALSSSQRSHSK
ncbi:flippase-like domain-containing protein [bacterium]|nr:flippase-like domain-containing protein [bacterium]